MFAIQSSLQRFKNDAECKLCTNQMSTTMDHFLPLPALRFVADTKAFLDAFFVSLSKTQNDMSRADFDKLVKLFMSMSKKYKHMSRADLDDFVQRWLAREETSACSLRTNKELQIEFLMAALRFISQEQVFLDAFFVSLSKKHKDMTRADFDMFVQPWLARTFSLKETSADSDHEPHSR